MLSEEQMQLRCGKLTASSISKIMGAKGFGKTGETYLWEVIAEKETGLNKEVKTTKEMHWGNEHEAEAAAYYAKAKSIDIKPGESISFGELVVTPDYTFTSESDNYGIEIKCPYNSANQSKRLRFKSYLDIKKNNPEYYWQMVAGMLATGFKEWKFLSYDPRMKEQRKKMVVISVPYVEEDMNLLKQRLSEAVKFMASNDAPELDEKESEVYDLMINEERTFEECFSDYMHSDQSVDDFRIVDQWND